MFITSLIMVQDVCRKTSLSHYKTETVAGDTWAEDEELGLQKLWRKKMQEEHVAAVSGGYDYDDTGEDSDIITGWRIKNKPRAKVESVN